MRSPTINDLIDNAIRMNREARDVLAVCGVILLIFSAGAYLLWSHSRLGLFAGLGCGLFFLALAAESERLRRKLERAK